MLCALDSGQLSEKPGAHHTVRLRKSGDKALKPVLLVNDFVATGTTPLAFSRRV